MEPFIGEIRPFAFGFAPVGWLECAGQTMTISQNTALYSLLGVRYGGDGKSTFKLPDLRGRVPVAQGIGPDGTPYAIGSMGGVETVTLSVEQLFVHSHVISCSDQVGESNSPQGTQLAAAPSGNSAYVGLPATGAGGFQQMSKGALTSAGSSVAHNNLQPSLVINFCIAVTGIFPPRS